MPQLAWHPPHELRTVILEGISLSRNPPTEPPQGPPHLANGGGALGRELDGLRLLAIAAVASRGFALHGPHCGRSGGFGPSIEKYPGEDSEPDPWLSVALAQLPVHMQS